MGEEQFQSINIENLMNHEIIVTENDTHNNNSQENEKRVVKNIDEEPDSDSDQSLTMNFINQFKDRYVSMFNSSINEILIKSDKKNKKTYTLKWGRKKMVYKNSVNGKKYVYSYNFLDGHLTINDKSVNDKEVLKFFKVIHNATIDAYNKKSMILEIKKNKGG